MEGIYSASITPFDNANRVNTKALKQLLHMNIQQGVDGFFIGGSSAECFLLSPEERVEIFCGAADFLEEVDIYAHVGAIGTDEAIYYAKKAKELGYTKIAATPPLYYGFSQEQIAQYYMDISHAVDLPVLVYNFPGNSGKEFNLKNPAIKAMFQSDVICGIKHTNLNLFQSERIKNLNPNLKIFNGFDETTLGALALGADGSIGSTFNFTYPHYKKIYDAYFAGDLATARSLQIKANNVMDALCEVGLIPAIKYVLSTMGIDAGIPRRPFTPLTKEQQLFVDAALAKDQCNN